VGLGHFRQLSESCSSLVCGQSDIAAIGIHDVVIERPHQHGAGVNGYDITFEPRKQIGGAVSAMTAIDCWKAAERFDIPMRYV